MNRLHFVGHLVRDHRPARMVYTAYDGVGRLYTIGLNTDGTDGFTGVYDPTTLENLYASTHFGYRVHADELKRTLQHVADGYVAAITH